MTATLEALHRLQQKSLSLKAAPVPAATDAPPVKTQLQIVTELTFAYILKLLGVEDEKTLGRIVARLRTGTPFYDFTFLVHNLAKSKTDFDFLSSPENIPAYAKIAEVSGDCGIELLPYVNVLSRIAKNKQDGLYRENQEVEFFLDEYLRKKNSVGAKEFLRQFKKILRYDTQQLLERLMPRDGIFSVIKETLSKNSEKIASERTLAIYVYGLRYYQNGISNADENFLIGHIQFCVSALARHGDIAFYPAEQKRLIPQFTNEQDAVTYFLNRFENAEHSLDRFVGLLKDIRPSEQANAFCDFLRKNRGTQNATRYDTGQNEFLKILAQELHKRKHKRNGRMYAEIAAALPELYTCACSRNILRKGEEPLLMFYSDTDDFMFYALKHGNKSATLPPANVLVDVEIFERNESGRYAVSWRWHERA